jgi:hypothetical protein
MLPRQKLLTVGEQGIWQEELAWSTGKSVWSMVTQFSDLGLVAGLADANTSAMNRYHALTEDVYRAQQLM